MLKDVALSLTVGQTAKIQHGGCGDHKKRLYITRKSPELAVYFCQNCQSYSGSINLGGAYRRHREIPSPPGVFKLPEEYTQAMSYWHAAARVWLRKYLSVESIRKYQFGFTPSDQRLIIPTYYNNQLVSYQGRKFGDFGPKYVTKTSGKPEGTAWLCREFRNREELVICEDAVSAIKVEEAGYSSMACLGTSMSDWAKAQLISPGFQRVSIWLDNDNKHVVANRQKIAQFLGAIGVPEANTITILEDPKNLTTGEIQNVLN